MSKSQAPDGWSRDEWLQRQAVEAMPDTERSEEQWDLLDRPAVWSDEAPDPEGDDPALYSLGAGEDIDPE